MEGDAAYFSRRAEEERNAASKAIHLKAREAHSELANRYEDLASAIAARQRTWGIGQADDPLRVASS
jgi:hypothetical protein